MPIWRKKLNAASSLNYRYETLGRGDHQSVASFQLNGAFSEYIVNMFVWRLSALPVFCDGDEIVASGKMSSEDVFQAFSVYAPRLRKFSEGRFLGDAIMGLFLVLIGCSMTIQALRRRNFSVKYGLWNLGFLVAGFYLVRKAMLTFLEKRNLIKKVQPPRR